MWKEAISLRICFLVELIMESSVEISIAVHNFLPERNSFYANIDARLWDRWWGLAVISRASFPTWSPWAVSWENSHPFLGSAVIGIKFWSNVQRVVHCLNIAPYGSYSGLTASRAREMLLPLTSSFSPTAMPTTWKASTLLPCFSGIETVTLARLLLPLFRRKANGTKINHKLYCSEISKVSLGKN